EFHAHPEDKTVESVLPDRGSRPMSEALDDGTMTPRTAAYFAAFRDDLRSAVANVRSAKVTGDAISNDFYSWFYSCFSSYWDCDGVGQQGYWAGQWVTYTCQCPDLYCGGSGCALYI